MLGFSATRGVVVMMFASLLQGSHGLWANLIQDEFGAFYQGWSRSVIILLVLVPLMLALRSYRAIGPGDRKWYAIIVLFMLFTQAPIFYAYTTIGIAPSAFLFFSSWIIATYCIGRLFFNEYFTTIKIAALVFAGTGLLLMFSFSVEELAPLGMAMAVLTGLASASQVAFSKKINPEHSALQITSIMWGGVLLTHLPFAILAGETIVVPALSIGWMYQIGYAFSIMLSFWLMVVGFRYLQPGVGGLLGLFIVVFATMFGIVVLGEHLSISLALGGLSIIIAGLLPFFITEERKVAFESYLGDAFRGRV